MFRSNWTILRECMPSLAKATILWNWSVKVHHYMICGVVATSISGCDVCTACRVGCDLCATSRTQVAHYTVRSTAWNNCCHNAAYHIMMYFHWSIPQYCSFSKAWHTLLEDGPIGPKHVAANKEIFQLYVLKFYVFNKRVHLLVKIILILRLESFHIILFSSFGFC